jgi:hypothetical protein
MNTKLFYRLCTAILFMALFLAPSKVSAQIIDKIEVATVKDGYVMLDNKMMAINNGQLTPMKKSVTMANGTKIKKNGSVKPKGGKRVKMMNGHCIDNTGTIENCNVNSTYYTCTMHKDVRAAKNGKCPKCGMALVRKN